MSSQGQFCLPSIKARSTPRRTTFWMSWLMRSSASSVLYSKCRATPTTLVAKSSIFDSPWRVPRLLSRRSSDVALMQHDFAPRGMGSACRWCRTIHPRIKQRIAERCFAFSASSGCDTGRLPSIFAVWLEHLSCNSSVVRSRKRSTVLHGGRSCTHQHLRQLRRQHQLSCTAARSRHPFALTAPCR